MLKVGTQDSTRYVVIILITDACRHLSIEGAGALFLLLVLLLVLVQKIVLKPMCHAGLCCFLDPRQPPHVVPARGCKLVQGKKPAILRVSPEGCPSG